MALWIWIALALAGVFLLLLFLFRIHYRFDWNGGLDFSGALDYGFPGFKRGWKFPDTVDSVSEEPASSSSSHPTDSPASKKDTEPSSSGGSSLRMRRALFRFATDTAVLRALIGYGFRCLRLAFRLLHLDLTLAVGRRDPAQLGRLAGYWYAAKPFLGTRRMNVEFRFQDQTSSIRLRARGGFSLAQALACLFAMIAAFPWLLLVRKAWRSWRNPVLSGWRARVFGWMQKSPRMGLNS